MKTSISRLQTGAFACAAALLLCGGQATRASAFQTLHKFRSYAMGANPGGKLVLTKGVLYGTTFSGGNGNAGTVFLLNRDSHQKTLYQFQRGADGSQPDGLVADTSGNLYGVTGERGTIFKVTRDGSFTTLYTFQGGSDGDAPLGALLIDKSGALYGTTNQGGGNGCDGNGCGTVYKLAPDGMIFVLHVFGGSDGAFPVGGLVADKVGNLYGVTHLGGSGCQGYGCGTVYRLSSDGQESVLYAFEGGTDGQNPSGELVIDQGGNLFGVASGGQSICGSHGGLYCGIVFKIATDGTKTIVHAFNGTDGWSPDAGLAEDNSGNLYGTTEAGGGVVRCGTAGCGTVFKIAADGTYTVLHAFAGRRDGVAPDSPLVVDRDGHLFGTALQGGRRESCDGYGCGTIFEIIP